MTDKTYILDDLPAQRDALDFQPYIDTLAEVIASPNTRTPLTIGIFGSWGAGKTSLMQLVRKGLPKSYRTAWFDAWKYEKEETLWRALLLHVLEALQEAVPANETEDRKELDDLQTSLYRTVEREEVGGVNIDWSKLATGAAQGAVQIGLSFIPGGTVLASLVEELQGKEVKDAAENLVAAIRRERSKIRVEHVQFLEQFHQRFHTLVDKYVVQKKLRLVVFVDDLDRCLPEKAVEVLEAIKLFLDVPGCVFMLGLDDKVIARGVEIKYRQLGLGHSEAGEHTEGAQSVRQQRLVEGSRYLEKIIQLPFQLPPIDRREMTSFITGLVENWEDEECPKVFAAGLGGNPRQVKRTVNTHLLLTGLAARREGDIHPVRLAKIVTIQNALPTLYDFLKDDNHRYLKELETYFLAESPSPSLGEGVGVKGEMLTDEAAKEGISRTELSQILTPFLRQRGIASIRRVLTLHPEQPEYNFASLNLDQLRSYFTLTRRAEAPEIQSEQVVEMPRAAYQPQMVTVPAGPFVMGSTEEQVGQFIADGLSEDWAKREIPQHTVELSEYQIGKFPVTNREYQAFIRGSEHSPPHNWDGDQYPEGRGDHPVVYVYWHDAVAYCQWLSEKTDKVYSLPTEAQWEKAARGTDGRIYPWGDEWDAAKCNTKEGGAGNTTPAGQYSTDGDSPYGCADMIGNVWEWCADWFAEDIYQNREDGVKDPQGPNEGERRVLRGGFWGNDRNRARAAARDFDPPDFFVDYYGFRVVAASLSLAVDS